MAQAVGGGAAALPSRGAPPSLGGSDLSRKGPSMRGGSGLCFLGTGPSWSSLALAGAVQDHHAHRFQRAPELPAADYGIHGARVPRPQGLPPAPAPGQDAGGCQSVVVSGCDWPRHGWDPAPA